MYDVQVLIDELNKSKYHELIGASAFCVIKDILNSAYGEENVRIQKSTGDDVVFCEFKQYGGIFERLEAKDYNNLLKRVISHIYATNSKIVCSLAMIVWMRSYRW